MSSASRAVCVQEHVQCSLSVFFVGFPKRIVVMSEETVLFISLHRSSFYRHPGLPILTGAGALLKASNYLISLWEGCERFSGARIHPRLTGAIDRGGCKPCFTRYTSAEKNPTTACASKPLLNKMLRLGVADKSGDVSDCRVLVEKERLKWLYRALY